MVLQGHVIEYAGSAIENMSMEGRMTICNMSIECGARAGLVAPDQTTFDYIQGRRFAPKDEDWDRAIQLWSNLKSDEGSNYDTTISINVSQLDPMVTWGTNPGQGAPVTSSVPFIMDSPSEQHQSIKESLEYIDLVEGQDIQGTKIDWAFLGSCTNARIQDLRVAAEMLEGRQIADTVTMFVVPGSEQVKLQAEAEGLDMVFAKAGAEWRNPGCSSCLGMNDNKIPAGKRCISSSNRNFIGRQGPGSRTHLASPATVVASAIAGSIASPLPYF